MIHMATVSVGMKAFLEEAASNEGRVRMYLGHNASLTGIVEVREDVVAVFPDESTPPYIVPISTIVWARYWR